jgi:hypothetical protein
MHSAPKASGPAPTSASPIGIAPTTGGPTFPPKDRSVNYLPTKHPERWQRFKDHTYAQIEELMTGYGPVDILWLDGGWVRPLSTIDTSVSWQKAITIEQDIDMPRIAAMARSTNPACSWWTARGRRRTRTTSHPEGHVPDKDLGVPWETCMPMGTSWSWVPNEQYKTTDEIIRTLAQVVTRGGSLLLNVAPAPMAAGIPPRTNACGGGGLAEGERGSGVRHPRLHLGRAGRLGVYTKQGWPLPVFFRRWERQAMVFRLDWPRDAEGHRDGLRHGASAAPRTSRLPHA